jgi:hypothetical protein
LESSYENTLVGAGCSDVFFSCFIINNCSNIFYSSECFSCKNCFACSGLKNKQYCILNKQYSKEEYEKLVPQIIEKMQAD